MRAAKSTCGIDRLDRVALQIRQIHLADQKHQMYSLLEGDVPPSPMSNAPGPRLTMTTPARPVSLAPAIAARLAPLS